MPTGYTCNIENDQSFEDFALSCARAFGACIHQREDSSNDKPRLRDENSEYYETRLKEAKDELARLDAMSTNERIAYGEQLRQEQVERYREGFNNKVILRGKYESMLDKVNSWSPPTPSHYELKKFMIDQLNNSIDFDCNTKYDMEEIMRLSETKPFAAFEKKYNDALWSVKYYETELTNNADRNEEANKWITDLYQSLGIEYA